MKTLFLLRHAKSSWKDDAQSDYDRPLNERGKRDAPSVGRFLRERSLQPDLVLSSSAKRARKTARSVIDASGYDLELKLTDELYLAAPEAYIHELSKLPDEVQSVLLVGHNPGLEELLAQVTGRHRPLPTAALAHIELPIEHWSEFNRHCPARLVSFWRPSDEDES